MSNNAFERVAPINLWNLDKKLRQTGPATLAWEALTTGGFGGFDAWLADPLMALPSGTSSWRAAMSRDSGRIIEPRILTR